MNPECNSLHGWNGIFLREEACSSEVTTLYPIQRILWQRKTPFADAVLAEVPNLGACLFLDREIQSSAADEDIYHECLVHPVMAARQAKQPGKQPEVLVIGGGEGATVREVLKWDVGDVDWVDIDGEVVAACREHLKWGQDAAYTDPRVTYFDEDIRDFLQSSTTLYDVIIIDLPDPDPADNPFSDDVLMNVGFWRAIQSHLAPGGVWVTHAGPVRRKGASGASYLQKVLGFADIQEDIVHYHAVIPAFQDDWGYAMNCLPAFGPLPFPTRFLTEQAHRYVFEWAW
jgi:spermidine synthase